MQKLLYIEFSTVQTANSEAQELAKILPAALHLIKIQHVLYVPRTIAVS